MTANIQETVRYYNSSRQVKMMSWPARIFNTYFGEPEWDFYDPRTNPPTILARNKREVEAAKAHGAIPVK
jgi:hypothetical protein